MNKRGISAVVATVLMILITVAAVEIVWTTIVPMIKNSLTGIDVSQIDLKIDTSSGFTAYDMATGIGSVKITKGASEDYNLTGIKVFLENSEGTSEIYEVDFDISTGSKTFYFVTAEKPSSISIAPIILDGKTEKTGGIVYTAELKSGSILEIPEGANIIEEIGVVPECVVNSDCVSDNNECTADRCTDSSCEYVNMVDGSLCDGGNGECISGTCEDIETVFDFNVISVWHLDGNGNDATGTHSGTVGSGADCSVTGKLGQACEFAGSGSNSGITIPYTFSGLTDFTISAWIKVKGAHQAYSGAIISSGNWNTEFFEHWAFNIKENNDALQTRNPDKEINMGSFEIGQWYHVVISRIGSNMNYYVDGTNKGTLNVGNAPLDSAGSGVNTMIGRDAYTDDGYFGFNGFIDEVIIFDEGLSDTNVADLYDLQNSGIAYVLN
jgi:flagellin-like protein